MSNRDRRVTDTGMTTGPAPGSPAAELASKPGLRIRPHRPMRAVVGALIVVASVIAALALYARIGDRTEALALTRDIMAGEQLTDADLKVVSIGSEDNIPSVAASQRNVMVGQYARVRLLSGSLLAAESLQPTPLVSSDRVLMSVVVPVGQVPTGLREQSRIVLVVSPKTDGGQGPPPILVEAIVTAIPRNLGEVVGESDSAQGTVALSIEVPPQYVAAIGEADAVNVGVIDPSSPFPGTQVLSADVSQVSESAGSEPADPAVAATTLPSNMTVPSRTTAPDGTEG